MTKTDQAHSPRKLAIIGLSLDGLSGVSLAALQAIDEAEIIFGGARHLEIIKARHTTRQALGHTANLKLWDSPFHKTLQEISELRWHHKVALLATGDPFWFGVGASIVRTIPADELQVFPHISAFSLAAAAMGWPLQDVTCTSCHGRPISDLHRWLSVDRRLIVLTNDGLGPSALAAWLRDVGWGQSEMTILEKLGPGGVEQRYSVCAKDCDAHRFDDLNTVAVQLRPDKNVVPYGHHLPDHAFVHDGKITRQIVRTASLTALVPSPEAMLWDIGAGCGSIAIEWLRMEPTARAIAIEPQSGRLEMIHKNRVALGAERLVTLQETAPEACAQALAVGAPDAIFIGGGLSTTGVVEACLEALKPGGRLVAHAVTLESEAVLLNLHNQIGGQLSRLSIAEAHPIGAFSGWRPAMPVTQFRYMRLQDSET